MLYRPRTLEEQALTDALGCRVESHLLLQAGGPAAPDPRADPGRPAIRVVHASASSASLVVVIEITPVRKRVEVESELVEEHGSDGQLRLRLVRTAVPRVPKARNCRSPNKRVGARPGVGIVMILVNRHD